MEASPCKHFQTGYCKICEHCRKQHIIEICQTKDCPAENCIKRHPKMCKYINTYCRFGDKCCYKHVTTDTQENTLELEAKVYHFEEIIKTMSSKIISLENEMSSIKKSYLFTTVFKCEECNYNASSETVLNRHITTKYKHLSKTPEKSRDSIFNDSLKVAEYSEEKKRQSRYFSL